MNVGPMRAISCVVGDILGRMSVRSVYRVVYAVGWVVLAGAACEFRALWPSQSSRVTRPDGRGCAYACGEGELNISSERSGWAMVGHVNRLARYHDAMFVSDAYG